MIKRDSKKKAVLRDLSSCIVEKFNGFNIACVEFSKKLRQPFRPIDIIYKLVKRSDEIINCFFSEKLQIAFRASFNEGTKIKHCSAWRSCFCSNYYSRKDKFDRNFKNCTGRPSYVYNFKTQNLLTFEENLKYKGDIPLVANIDFETIAPTDKCIDPENSKIFPVCYVIVFTFRLYLDIDRVIIERRSLTRNIHKYKLSHT